MMVSIVNMLLSSMSIFDIDNKQSDLLYLFVEECFQTSGKL